MALLGERRITKEGSRHGERFLYVSGSDRKGGRIADSRTAVLGPLTVTLGILAFLFLGTPRESLLLRTEEKRIAQARVVASRTGTDRLKRKWDWEQFRETFRDPVVYIFFFLVLINALPNGGTTSFGNLIFVSFGFDPLETILKGIIPQNVLGIAWFLTVGILTRKFRRIRFIMMMASLVPSFVGTLCISLLPKTPDYRWPKYGCCRPNRQLFLCSDRAHYLTPQISSQSPEQ